jgi:hypothetical protein
VSQTSAPAPTVKFLNNDGWETTGLASKCVCGCASRRASGVGVSKFLLLLPALALLLAPKCPLCLAAWFGILGSFGASSWMSAAWGTALAAGLLMFTFGALALRARQSRNRVFGHTEQR